MKHPRLAVTAMAVGALAVAAIRAQSQADRPLDPQVLVWDKGPDKVNVSKYPADIKEKYKTFAELCGKCHTLARAINCDFVLEDDWERYIKRMMRRDRTLITPTDAQRAFDFAVFDSKVRKRDLYERKLREGDKR